MPGRKSLLLLLVSSGVTISACLQPTSALSLSPHMSPDSLSTSINLILPRIGKIIFINMNGLTGLVIGLTPEERWVLKLPVRSFS